MQALQIARDQAFVALEDTRDLYAMEHGRTDHRADGCVHSWRVTAAGQDTDALNLAHRNSGRECTQWERLTEIGVLDTKAMILRETLPSGTDVASAAFDISVDNVVFGFDGEQLQVLLIRQGLPGEDMGADRFHMAIPGDLVYPEEGLDEGAHPLQPDFP